MYYRPNWTTGRYHKNGKNSYALMYNFLEGLAFFFEDESAELINAIIRKSKNQPISTEELFNQVGGEILVGDIRSFCEELIDAGLILPCDLQISSEGLANTRKEVGKKRKAKAQNIIKTVQERLPFLNSDAENSYLEILEKDGIPFSVMFELTYNCNERCIHCFNPGAARNETERSTRHERVELKYEDYEYIVKQLKALGVVKIVLSGGDPFVKKDIWKIIELIYQEGFALDIFTNGLAIENKVERVASYFPNGIGLSIYSNIDAVHDGITNVKGSLQKTKFVAKQFGDLGIPLYLKCPIMVNNLDSYDSVKGLAKEYGALPQFDINLTDSMDGDISIGYYLQVKGKWLERLLRDPDIPLYVGPEAPDYGKKQINLNDNFCGAGFSSLSISPEGDITPCNSLALKIGNVRENDIERILRTSETLRQWKETTIKDYEECATHERCYYCNRCPGQSLIEHGNYLKASSANCQMANTRMLVAEKLKNCIDPMNEPIKIQKGIGEEIHRIESKSYRNIQKVNSKG